LYAENTNAFVVFLASGRRRTDGVGRSKSLRRASLGSGGKPVCGAGLGRWWRGKVGPGHGAPLSLLYCKRLPAGDVLVARDQLFVVVDARARALRHVKSARDSGSQFNADIVTARTRRESDVNEDSNSGCSGATHHTAGKIQEFHLEDCVNNLVIVIMISGPNSYIHLSFTRSCKTMIICGRVRAAVGPDRLSMRLYRSMIGKRGFRRLSSPRDII